MEVPEDENWFPPSTVLYDSKEIERKIVNMFNRKTEDLKSVIALGLFNQEHSRDAIM